MEAARAELGRTHAVEPPETSKEVVELEPAPHSHVHEAEVATQGLRARMRSATVGTQLKLIEATPALAPFLETQAACACKAGCPNCAGPTIFAPLWAATKDWAARKFSHSRDKEDPTP